MANKKEKLFRIKFVNQSDIYELYVKSIGACDLFGFIEISEFVFGQNASFVVDPAEEKLKNEFEGVYSTYIPMHAVLRIDEVDDKVGMAKITQMDGKAKSNVSHFPSPIYTPAVD